MSNLPLTDLPHDWKLERLDRLFRVIKEPARVDDAPISAFIDGVVTLRSNRPDAIIKSSGQEIGYKHLEKGDLVLSGMNAHLGGLGISDSSGKCTPVYTVLRKQSDLEERFISYYLWHAAQSGYIKSLVNAVRYNSADFGPETVKRFMVPVPPLKEQTEIADYLDLRTSSLKLALEKTEVQIQKLLELKYSILHKAIWAPRDQNQSVPVRRLVTCLDGMRVPLNSEERYLIPGNIPYWGAGSIVDYISEYIFDEPLVLLGEDGAPFFDKGKEVAFYVDSKIWPNNHIHVLRANVRVDSRYLVHALNATDYSAYITGSTRDKLTQEELLRISIPLPELDEQLKTVDILDAKLPRIAKQVDLLRAQMEMLIEYKKAVVSESVTSGVKSYRKNGAK